MRWTQEQYEEYLRRTASQKQKSPVITHSYVKLSCKTCGVDFESYPAHHRKFCSLTCAYADKDRVAHAKKKDRGSRTCKACGKSFIVQTRAPKAIFCSQLCAGRFIGGRTMRENRRIVPKLNWVTYVCAICGKSFEAWKSSGRKYCSVSCSSKDPELLRRRVNSYNSNPDKSKLYSTHTGKWVEVGGKRFFGRSSWERNYGRYLQFQKEQKLVSDWEHEPMTFWFDGIKRGTRSYLPDFKVTLWTGEEEYHEVKGWMTPKSKTQIRRMAKYHSKIKLVVIDQKRYQALAKIARSIINEWE